MKLNKKIVASLIGVMTLVNSFPAFAATRIDQVNPQSKTLDINSIDINKLSKDNNVDPSELRTSIEKSLKSHRFSPFSDVKSQKNTKSSSEINNRKNVKLDSDDGTTYQSGEDSTAYTDTETASGVDPEVGMVAVHHYRSGKPYIPFGTQLTYSSPITIQGNDYTDFSVQDTGDAHFNRSSYWTDIYFGSPSDDNEQACLDYGVQSVDYSYTL